MGNVSRCVISSTIPIASKDKHMFLVGAGQELIRWKRNGSLKEYTSVLLPLDNMHEFSGELKC